MSTSSNTAQSQMLGAPASGSPFGSVEQRNHAGLYEKAQEHFVLREYAQAITALETLLGDGAHGEGGYLREPESVLLSVVSNRQLPRLEKLAHAIDPTCFMIVSHVTEVSGRGFSLEKDYQAEG